MVERLKRLKGESRPMLEVNSMPKSTIRSTRKRIDIELEKRAIATNGETGGGRRTGNSVMKQKKLDHNGVDFAKMCDRAIVLVPPRYSP